MDLSLTKRKIATFVRFVIFREISSQRNVLLTASPRQRRCMMT